MRIFCSTNSGVSLVELMISMLIASTLMMVVYSIFQTGSQVTAETRKNWYCMQSIRGAILQIDRDMLQNACLVPQDMKVVCLPGELFIGGVPATAGYSGLRLNSTTPPPYYAVVTEVKGSALLLDNISIDADADPDFWAGLGIITDNGAYVIANGYTRGNTLLRLKSTPKVRAGDRVIPSVHYALKGDGLYRNGQILAENISAFAAKQAGAILTINMSVKEYGVTRDVQYQFPIT